MTTISKYAILSSTLIHDGRGGKEEAKPGNLVDVLPADIVRYPADTDDRQAREENYLFMKRWLGKGPYIVSEIRLWSTGNIMLYLSTRHGSVGVHDYDVMRTK